MPTATIPPAPTFGVTRVVAPTFALATATPLPTMTATPTYTPLSTVVWEETAVTPHTFYLPAIANLPPTPTVTPTPTLLPTPTPTLDFAMIRTQVEAQGQQLVFAKIGFHTGFGGGSAELEQWMTALDSAGVPFFLKSTDNAGPLLFAQQLRQQSGVPHTLVFRSTGNDVPNYDLPPAEAAQHHWQWHIDRFPPELDPTIVWLETMNEVDKNRSVWLAEVAHITANYALAENRRWAAFGWSSGEPELADWQTAEMQTFLQLVSQYPEQLAIALHEYSYTTDSISDGYPFLVGRFQSLYQQTDQMGLNRPTILITEWGWTYQHVPTPANALAHIQWANDLYASYPQVKGAAIWYLGRGEQFAEINEETRQLILPLMHQNLGSYYAIPQTNMPINPDQHAP